MAVRHNEYLKTFYQCLRANAKPAKVSLVASSRQLLVCLNSLLSQPSSSPP